MKKIYLREEEKEKVFLDEFDFNEDLSYVGVNMAFSRAIICGRGRDFKIYSADGLLLRTPIVGWEGESKKDVVTRLIKSRFSCFVFEHTQELLTWLGDEDV